MRCQLECDTCACACRRDVDDVTRLDMSAFYARREIVGRALRSALGSAPWDFVDAQFPCPFALRRALVDDCDENAPVLMRHACGRRLAAFCVFGDAVDIDVETLEAARVLKTRAIEPIESLRARGERAARSAERVAAFLSISHTAREARRVAAVLRMLNVRPPPREFAPRGELARRLWCWLRCDDEREPSEPSENASDSDEHAELILHFRKMVSGTRVPVRRAPRRSDGSSLSNDFRWGVRKMRTGWRVRHAHANDTTRVTGETYTVQG